MNTVVLTGFMASGKSTVGRQLAEKLGQPFVDLDELIAARAGKPIPDIFKEQGEAIFRKLENELCQELSRQAGLVIATGGGTLVNPENRALFATNSLMICLSCSVDETLRRVDQSGSPVRPLLNVSDRRAEIERLTASRRNAYSSIPWQIDTTNLDINQIVERILPVAQTLQLQVRHPDGQYPIYIGLDCLNHLGNCLHAAGLPQGVRVALVANPTVAVLYGQQAAASLVQSGYHPCLCSLPDGEAFKNLAAVQSLYEQFLEHQIDRQDIILALGGGVTGDITGFAAATYLRGLRFVQVPTTLLSMVDSSVGGKTGVDLPQGKNLVGAFKQPEAVIIDPSVLSSLPIEELRSGLAEVIKHGVIADPGLFEQLEAVPGHFEIWWGDSSVQLLARAVKVKIDIVQQDPFEHGRRAALNLGHTLGHAVEQVSGFTLRHGEAVALGMIAAAHFSIKLGFSDKQFLARLVNLIAKWGLPIDLPSLEINSILKTILHDKKKRGKSIRWVLPYQVGQVEIDQTVPVELVQQVTAQLMGGEGR